MGVAPLPSWGFPLIDDNGRATQPFIAWAISISNAVTPVTVAQLQTAGDVGAGARAFVSDATATTFASIVAGGGTNNVPVYCDGTDWRIG